MLWHKSLEISLKDNWNFCPYVFNPSLGVVLSKKVLKNYADYCLLERMIAVLKLSNEQISKLAWYSDKNLNTDLQQIISYWQPEKLLIIGNEIDKLHLNNLKCFVVESPDILRNNLSEKKKSFNVLCELEKSL